jgi:hypothetical protein
MSGDHNMFQKSRSYDDDTQYDEAQVQAMIRKAVRDEREACAKVCEERQEVFQKYYTKGLAAMCAEAIRARGEQ